MVAYAFSVVKELSDDGRVKVFQPGDKLEGLSKERVAHLLEVGAASTYDRTKSTGDQVEEVTAEKDELEAKVHELEKRLQEATEAKATAEAKLAASQKPASSGNK